MRVGEVGEMIGSACWVVRGSRGRSGGSSGEITCGRKGKRWIK